MAREPQLSDYELRLLRGMMDEYSRQRAVDSWISARWKVVVVGLGALSAIAVLAASVVQLVQVVQ